MRRLQSIFLVVTLVCPGFLLAQDPLPPKVTGVVKNLDLKVGTITVRPTRQGATSDETFNLHKKDIDVTAPVGQKVRLDAVRPGQTVQLRFGLTGDVDAIAIQASTFLATVADVDLKSRIITMADPPNQPTTMAVDAAAKILLANRPAYLREVKLGSQMKVTPSLDGKMVLALNLVSDPDGKLAAKLFPRIKTSRLPGNRWVGILTNVNPQKSELQLTGPKTKGVPKSMAVAKDAVIKMLHGQVPVRDLALNQVTQQVYATVLVSVENQQVTHILVPSPVVAGKIKVLDAERGHLIAEVEGNDRTFALPRDVKVMAGNRVRRLGELEPNLPVSLVLSLDRTELLAIDVR